MTSSQSKTAHNLQLKIQQDLVSVPIPCNKHSYICKQNAVADLVFTIVEFYGQDPMPECVFPHDITAVSLKEGGKDGWFVESVYTTYITKSGRELPMTANGTFNMWLDSDSGDDRLEHQLTMIDVLKRPDSAFFFN